MPFLQLFQDGVRLVAGYEDGAVKVWDLRTNSVLHQVPQSVHEMRVTAIDTHPENNLVVSISSDGRFSISHFPLYVYKIFLLRRDDKQIQ